MIEIEMIEIPGVTFKIGKYPVTQEQYQEVMGINPSYFINRPQNPVESVSYNDAIVFCQKLRKMTGKTYRLPTNSEWEYACRAGTETLFSFGNDFEHLKDYAWYEDNSGLITHPVGQKKPNAWGLYDTHGNVWEWCFGGVPRGGGFDTDSYRCCAAQLSYLYLKESCGRNIGFRVVCGL
jgi:formylglycine-generating enzyme required for sulfatase activity